MVRPAVTPGLVPAPTEPLPARVAAAAGTVTTPALLLDPTRAVAAADALVLALAGAAPAHLRYAMKAGPHPELLTALDRAGHGVELASVGEAAVLHAVAPHAPVLCGNPMLDAHAIHGIRTFFPHAVFVADSPGQLRRLAGVAPGVRVLLRFHATDPAAAFQLSEKFGAPVDEIPGLLVAARSAGLVPVGFSFHLGSQSRSPAAWVAVIETVRALVGAARRAGFAVPVLDVGGGFPYPYPVGGAPLAPILAALAPALAGLRAEHPELELWCEPGRAIVAPASWLVATVTALREPRAPAPGVAHLDAGVYQGLMEASHLVGEFGFSVHHLPAAPGVPGATAAGVGPDALVPWRLVGPTCDAYDALAHRYLLPASLAEGDRLVFAHAGAYAVGCSTSFNGFPGPAPVALPAVGPHLVAGTEHA